MHLLKIKSVVVITSSYVYVCVFVWRSSAPTRRAEERLQHDNYTKTLKAPVKELVMSGFINTMVFNNLDPGPV